MNPVAQSFAAQKLHGFSLDAMKNRRFRKAQTLRYGLLDCPCPVRYSRAWCKEDLQ